MKHVHKSTLKRHASSLSKMNKFTKNIPLLRCIFLGVDTVGFEEVDDPDCSFLFKLNPRFDFFRAGIIISIFYTIDFFE